MDRLQASPEIQPFLPHGEVPIPAPILSEVLCALEILTLRFSPVFYGFNTPRGDGAGVVIVPGLLGIDLNLFEMHAWLGRIGYRPYYSGIGFTAGCPDLLSQQLDTTIDRAYRETGRRVHLIGHSLGGIFARSAAVRRPRRVASVITLGSPYRGLVAHRLIFAVAENVREWIRATSPDVSAECGTSKCNCPFGRSLAYRWPASVRQTAVYTKSDGIVDWRYCRSGRPEVDVEVGGTHIGLPFNAGVLKEIASRLSAGVDSRRVHANSRSDCRYAAVCGCL